MQMTKESADTLVSSPLSAKKSRRGGSIFGTVIRTLLLDSPLLLVFGIYMGVMWVHHVHDNYLVPQMAAAKWEEDERDATEMTYYYRECDEDDMSTTNGADLFLPENATPEEAYQHNLLHGFTLFPRVLSEETAAGLRKHIRSRIMNLTEEDNIWLEEQENRWSFPLGTEEPYVAQALMEVASNRLLKESMAKILGDNPAMIEMTAITAAHGAKAQSWHQDGPTAPARFGRGFRAGYSVFIQLQNTTKAMGATGACPGLYMCSEVPQQVCEKNGLQPVNEHGYWRAGDALVMNMDSTHRGSAHYDPDALERVMFIMTFTAKPRSRAESRQIIQGITFSLRWDMWGFTWQDLLHADTEMIQPWATLRALGLYKKPEAEWGVDYITSSCERIAKEDFGFFREHLDDFISFGGFKFIPQWLQGQVNEDDEDESWPEFLLDTIERCEAFLRSISFQLAFCYVVLFFTISMLTGVGVKGRMSRFAFSLLRLGLIYGIAVTLYHAAIKHVDESDWAYDIRNGLKYASPFGNEETAFNGPTTLPNRYDVLIETRYKSKYLALYNDFISNHPGNRLWNILLNEKAEVFSSYGGLPTVFRNAVSEFIVSAVQENSGRFLYQSPDAQWIVLSDDDAIAQTSLELAVKSKPIKQHVVKELEYLISEMKYDHRRESAMSARILPYLLELKKQLAMGVPQAKGKVTAVREEGLEPIRGLVRYFRKSRAMLPKLEQKVFTLRRPIVLHVGKPPEEPEEGAWLKAGDFAEVLIREGRSHYWYKVQVSMILSTGACLVYFPGEDDEESMDCKKLRHFVPPAIGEILEVNADGSYYECEILRDKGGGLYDISAEGDTYEDVEDALFRRNLR